MNRTERAYSRKIVNPLGTAHGLSLHIEESLEPNLCFGTADSKKYLWQEQGLMILHTLLGMVGKHTRTNTQIWN